MRGDHGPGEDVPGVAPDAESLRRAVHVDEAEVGGEVEAGVLGGEAALERVAVALHLVLAEAQLRQGVALCHPNLGVHKVDPGEN